MQEQNGLTDKKDEPKPTVSTQTHRQRHTDIPLMTWQVQCYAALNIVTELQVTIETDGGI